MARVIIKRDQVLVVGYGYSSEKDDAISELLKKKFTEEVYFYNEKYAKGDYWQKMVLKVVFVVERGIFPVNRFAEMAGIYEVLYRLDRLSFPEMFVFTSKDDLVTIPIEALNSWRRPVKLEGRHAFVAQGAVFWRGYEAVDFTDHLIVQGKRIGGIVKFPDNNHEAKGTKGSPKQGFKVLLNIFGRWLGIGHEPVKRELYLGLLFKQVLSIRY